MNNDYILKIAESKSKYHRDKSKMSYEEKFEIILALQKLDMEIRKINPAKIKGTVNYTVWHLENDKL